VRRESQAPNYTLGGKMHSDGVTSLQFDFNGQQPAKETWSEQHSVPSGQHSAPKNSALQHVLLPSQQKASGVRPETPPPAVQHAPPKLQTDEFVATEQHVSFNVELKQCASD
jgi:hypothetical protein